MVSSGNGTIGAEKLTEEVFNIVQRVPDLVKNLTGVDIAKVRTKLVKLSTVKEKCKVNLSSINFSFQSVHAA